MILPPAAGPPKEVERVPDFFLLVARHLKSMPFKVRAQLRFSAIVKNTNNLVVLFLPSSTDPAFDARKKPEDNESSPKQIYGQGVKATANSHPQSRGEPNCRGGGNANDPSPVA